jgi:CDP-4-dehydro-6-deoxyglucose reductase
MAEPGITLPPVRLAEPLTFDAPYEVVTCDRVTPTIAELSLRPLGERLNYLPGEYVLLEDDGHAIPPRSYSIANAPRPNATVSLLVTRVPGRATSAWVHERLHVGEIVRLSGPYGTFVDDPIAATPAVLLAAGSGLAPIRALLEAALIAGRRRDLTLIFSARCEADLIDRDRFAAWQATHARFRFIGTLTRGTGPPHHGRIPAMLPSLFADLSDHDVFIAGAPRFVRACAVAADALGAARARIHTEAFFAERLPWTDAAPQPEVRD